VSQIWLVVLGGALTAVGGFGAAWYTNRRTDDIAQAIRRAQRREDALLALHAKTGEVYDAVLGILKAAKERGQSTGQYVAVLGKLRELSELWLWESMVAIPDASIGHAYLALDKTVRALLPDDQGALKYMEVEIGAQGSVFVANLETVLGLLKDFKAAVEVQTVALLYPSPSWLRRAVRRARHNIRSWQERRAQERRAQVPG
jgi:hypothetical protein